MAIAGTARFNPRPREGGDSFDTIREHCYFGFNPRPREGGDIIFVRCAIRYTSFNPRPREGGDRARFVVSVHVVQVSIRAPVKGATATS